MNIVAIDIGNTTVSIGLYVEDQEKFIKHLGGADRDGIRDVLIEAWEQVPFVKSDKVDKRDGVIVVSSVKPEWLDIVKEICDSELGEKIMIVGKDVPLPIEMGVKDYRKVGTDRVVNAAAAFAVVEDAVVVADFGSAITIDLVDEEGVFLGGVIAPGFKIAAEGLCESTAQLPEVEVTRPKDPVGANTNDAINAGLYYSAVGLLRLVVEKFAMQIGRWPQTVVTGGNAEIIKADCDFIDSWVTDLAVKGILLAYKKHLSDQAHIAELGEKQKKGKK